MYSTLLQVNHERDVACKVELHIMAHLWEPCPQKMSIKLNTFVQLTGNILTRPSGNNCRKGETNTFPLEAVLNQEKLDFIHSPFRIKKGIILIPLSLLLALLFRASLVAQMVKSLPAMWEIWVQSLSQEDPLRRKW